MLSSKFWIFEWWENMFKHWAWKGDPTSSMLKLVIGLFSIANPLSFWLKKSWTEATQSNTGPYMLICWFPKYHQKRKKKIPVQYYCPSVSILIIFSDTWLNVELYFSFSQISIILKNVRPERKYINQEKNQPKL